MPGRYQHLFHGGLTGFWFRGATGEQGFRVVEEGNNRRAMVHVDDLAEATRQMGDFTEALALDQQITSEKARKLLGWSPRHKGFLNDVDLYFAAWKASR